MQLNILGASAQAKYNALNAQRTINYYLVIGTQSEQNKNPRALYPFPGTTLLGTASGRYHRGAFVATGINVVDRCFFVVDQTLNELGIDGTITNRGTLTNIPYGQSQVYFAINDNNQMYIGHDSAGYTYTLSTDTLTAISDPQFPGSSSADYGDGYLVVAANGRCYFNTVLNDYTQWNQSSQVISETTKTDNVLAVRFLKEELYLFGSKTISVFLNDGTSPFSRRQGSTIQFGIAAKNSLCTTNDGHFFVGRNKDGQFEVYFLGYDYFHGIQQISDFNRTWALNHNVNAIGSAYGFIQYTKTGNTLYHLTIPELKTTWVYDMQSKEWVERQSRQPYDDSDGENVYREYRYRYMVNFGGKNIFFDGYSGAIAQEDYTVMTDLGQIIKRIRTTQTYSQDEEYISVSQLDLDVNRGEAATSTGQGSTPIIMLEISRDGGYTFGNPRNIQLGSLGKYISRAKINKLGTARRWVFRLTVTDPIDIMLQNAIAHGVLSGAAPQGPQQPNQG